MDHRLVQNLTKSINIKKIKNKYNFIYQHLYFHIFSQDYDI